MSLALTANIILDTIVFSAIVAMLAWAIRSSRPERLEHQTRPERQARPAMGRAAHARGARPRARGSFERIEA